MKKILVVEDEEAIRSNVLDLLEAEGFGTIGAENGLVGVRLAREHLPNLIICDIMMPELDGYSVLEELRQDPVAATIPFVFLTAKADKVDLRQGMELGADDYLTKPFTRTELLKAIDTRLAKQAAVNQKFQKQMEDLRGSITLSLPHELRTPLSGVLTGSTILKDDYESLDRHDIHELVKIIHNAAERLNRLVLNYLLYAELEITMTHAEMVQTLRQSRTGFTSTVTTHAASQVAKRAGRETDLNLDLHEATARITETHLNKIVEELLDNAFKYSKAGTPVHVTSRTDNSTFTLSVIDNGRGMTAAQIADIGAYMQFERMIHEQQGSGLGLAIASRLTEAYGGELTIESIPGRQTTVRVTLPV